MNESVCLTKNKKELNESMRLRRDNEVVLTDLAMSFYSNLQKDVGIFSLPFIYVIFKFENIK